MFRPVGRISDDRPYAIANLPARAPQGSMISRPSNRLRSGSSWNARAHRSSFDGLAWIALLLVWNVETLARGLRDRDCQTRFDGTSQRFHDVLRPWCVLLLALFHSIRDISLTYLGWIANVRCCPALHSSIHAPNKEICFVDFVPLKLFASHLEFTHANNSSMRACSLFASLGARTFASLSKYTKTSLFARLTVLFVLAYSPSLDSPPFAHAATRPAHSSMAFLLYPLEYNTLEPCRRQ